MLCLKNKKQLHIVYLWITLWVCWGKEKKVKPIVIKRDGSRAPFNRDRIQAAVEAAAEIKDKDVDIFALNVALSVELQLKDHD